MGKWCMLIDGITNSDSGKSDANSHQQGDDYDPLQQDDLWEQAG